VERGNKESAVASAVIVTGSIAAQAEKKGYPSSTAITSAKKEVVSDHPTAVAQQSPLYNGKTNLVQMSNLKDLKDDNASLKQSSNIQGVANIPKVIPNIQPARRAFSTNDKPAVLFTQEAVKSRIASGLQNHRSKSVEFGGVVYEGDNIEVTKNMIGNESVYNNSVEMPEDYTASWSIPSSTVADHAVPLKTAPPSVSQSRGSKPTTTALVNKVVDTTTTEVGKQSSSAAALYIRESYFNDSQYEDEAGFRRAEDSGKFPVAPVIVPSTNYEPPKQLSPNNKISFGDSKDKTKMKKWFK
jgi:hypothetical protein